MRKKTQKEAKADAKKIVENHHWFKELVNKVVVLNGAKREVTSQETLILQELKRYAYKIILLGWSTLLLSQFMYID